MDAYWMTVLARASCRGWLTKRATGLDDQIIVVLVSCDERWVSRSVFGRVMKWRYAIHTSRSCMVSTLALFIHHKYILYIINSLLQNLPAVCFVSTMGRRAMSGHTIHSVSPVHMSEHIWLPQRRERASIAAGCWSHTTPRSSYFG